MSEIEKSYLGNNLKPGDDHYRAYVGPPEDYDLVSAMVFNLLTCSGLRQHHKVLDIGCGSIRIGRLLIPYLNRGNYYGVEPNKWLVEKGIEEEVGNDLIRIKNPTFSYRDNLSEFKDKLNINFAIAQSIFSHTGIDLLTSWIKQVSNHLADDGAIFATFILGPEDTHESGWVYPGCVDLSIDTIDRIAQENGLQSLQLNWAHPRQSWVLLYKANFDFSSIGPKGNLTWNAVVKAEKKRKLEQWKATRNHFSNIKTS